MIFHCRLKVIIVMLMKIPNYSDEIIIHVTAAGYDNDEAGQNTALHCDAEIDDNNMIHLFLTTTNLITTHKETQKLKNIFCVKHSNLSIVLLKNACPFNTLLPILLFRTGSMIDASFLLFITSKSEATYMLKR